MAKRSNLPSQTIMYSFNPGTNNVVTHYLPWPSTSPQLQRYVAKGFTFENPLAAQQAKKIEVDTGGKEVVTGTKASVKPKVIVAPQNKPGEFKCLLCGIKCYSQEGLDRHKTKKHKGV